MVSKRFFYESGRLVHDLEGDDDESRDIQGLKRMPQSSRKAWNALAVTGDVSPCFAALKLMGVSENC